MEKFAEYGALLFTLVLAPVIYLKIIGKSRSLLKKLLVIILIIILIVALQFIRVFINRN